MERPSFDGIEFYSETDWSLGDNLQRSALILDSLSNYVPCNSINEVIQFYNIQQIINCGARLVQWSDEEYKRYQDRAKELPAFIGKFLGNITDNNLLEIYESITIEYVDDFWELFDNYNVYYRITENSFYKLLCQHDSALYYILRHRKIVNKYDEKIASVMRSSKHTVSIISMAFLEKQENVSRIYFPVHLSKSEYEQILQEYINTADCDLGILHLIAIAQNSDDCPISDKLRLSARKRQHERFKGIMGNRSPSGMDFSITFDHIADNKKLEQTGNTFKITYDIDWLTDNLDYPTVLNNFIYVFEQFDFCMRSKLVSVDSKISSLERPSALKEKKSIF